LKARDPRSFQWPALVAAMAALALGPPAAAQGRACAVPAFETAAKLNTRSITSLEISTFRRPETGWAIYAPLIAHEIGSPCPFGSSGFAAAIARWKRAQGMRPDGLVTEDTLMRLKGIWQERRPFVRISAKGVCPEPPPPAALAVARPDESYGGKRIEQRGRALEAYRRMLRAARESAQVRADRRNLTIFSGYRSPAYDAARCERDGNCDGVTRATCSPHRTGLAFDLYVGQAAGFGPDSSADPNRLAQSRSAAYRWLLANGRRFGFVNYPFEPWHWEWIGEPP
jgi:zinc D-Ala-D-Ala carboxypeptidase